MTTVLIVLVVAVVIGGIFWLATKYNARTFRRATGELQPVLALIDGRPDRPFRWLGTFEGHKVRIVFNSQNDEKGRSNYWFELIMNFEPGGQKWTIHHHKHTLLSRGPDGWVVDCKDRRIAAGLEQGGAVRIAETVSTAIQFKYDPKRGDLMLTYGLNAFEFRLDPAVTKARLEMLRAIGQINQRVIRGETLAPAA